MTAPNLDPKDLKLLSEIALSAAVQGHGKRAKPIFDALQRLRPDNAAAAIGYALTEMTHGNFQEATRILRKDGITAKNGATEAKAMLMVALLMGGRAEEADPVQRELLQGADGPAKQIARLLRGKIKVDA